ncbi:DinB family protein [Vibrio tubiashii]|uniref:Damage-inducible protein DinB n=1 Tax=Vibrio tubiashii ATCC 19109 TaxID=1051646 RepID=F9T0Q5_9VIBR|nr:DinB family protein [Vibrio tubiashii]AIW14406.1 damage-inducible protein DinB [Vibrio tubiashii ATCC 19109]EGU58612.1 DinB family protein [Vibrio tubiashii ATCC 19109]EIF03965.1 DinB family protein [Vibrio tubiashii NCIMB 1337 = ATCC 19106]
MDLSANFRMLALYNQRMNQQLLSVCEQLSSQQLNQETHSFFPSVMAHWNHILFGDLIMLQRLITNQIHQLTPQQVNALPIAKAVDDTFVTSIEELKALRSLVDQIYIDMTKGFNAETCAKTVVYITTEGGEMRRNVGEFCQHIFNHQTHHRGQLTAILAQLGWDFGCTDLPVIVPEGSSALA